MKKTCLILTVMMVITFTASIVSASQIKNIHNDFINDQLVSSKNSNCDLEEHFIWGIHRTGCHFEDYGEYSTKQALPPFCGDARAEYTINIGCSDLGVENKVLR